MKRPYFLLLFAPVPVLAQQVTHLWQVPWWAGFRLAYLATFLMLLPFALLYRVQLPPRLVKGLNLVTGIMLITLLVPILATALIRDTKPHRQPHGLAMGPDIYLIVLDSYTGSTALLDKFGYDNSAFLDELTSLGFVVGECSSPATYTGASLGATLNLRTSAAPRLTFLNWHLVQRSLLRTSLEERGYDTIAFATGYDWDEIHDAAYYLAPEMSPGPTEFEIFVLEQTFLKFILPEDRRGDLFRARTLYLLDHLADAAEIPGSQFVFAHVVQPHPPFVFTAEGYPRADSDLVNPGWNGDDKRTLMYTNEDFAEGYIDQVTYISHAILEPLQEILALDPEAQILLFGDHGAWYADNPEQARSVLCAGYNLPPTPIEAVKEIINQPR